jgi:Skp family chaperone for outer membrane proteins
MFDALRGKALSVPGLLLLVGVIAALGLWASALEGAGDRPAAVLKVAVVDMSRVLKESREWRDAVEERARLLDTMKRTLTKLSRRNQVLRNEYENLPPGTEERQQKAAEIERALQEFQQARVDLEEQIARQHDKSVRGLFGKLNRIVAAYAQQNGVQLVLKKQDVDLAEPETVEQSLQIATTEVLYADPALDISDAVVEALNAAYEGPIEVK